MSSTLRSSRRAELQPAIQPHVRTARNRRRAQRHRLEERLIGGGAAQQEDLRRRVVLVAIAGVVVVDLVIVPGDDERRRGVRGPQVGIHLVLRVAIAVVDERVDLVALMLPHERRVAPAVVAPFVDVVAGVEDEVELLRGDAAGTR